VLSLPLDVQLSDDHAPPAAWVLLGAGVEDRNQAKAIFAAVDQEHGPLQSMLGWEYLGPFPSGKTELDADPLEVGRPLLMTDG
jgi:hypothetical protein